MIRAAIVVCLLITGSCISRRGTSFRVIPHNPSYLLRSPDSHETSFSKVLHAYNGFDPGRPSIDLHPLMELRIENAYYEKGASRRGLKGFLGTEVARYEKDIDRLKLLSVQPMKDRPQNEVPVQGLLSPSQTNFRYYRLYFEVLFHRNNDSHGSVLLGANSTEELDQLSAQLENPEAVCNSTSTNCTVFPEACSVSVEMKIFVNGKPRDVLWGSTLVSLTEHPRHLRLRRLYNGQLTAVKLNARDPNALKLPLLPGDQIVWN